MRDGCWLAPPAVYRLVIDWPMPGKVRGAETFGKHAGEMSLSTVSGDGKPLRTSRGWTTSLATVNDDARHAAESVLPLMAGTWGADLEQTAVGRKSSRPNDTSTITGLLQAMTNPLNASGTSMFSVASGPPPVTSLHPVGFDRWFVSSENHTPDTPIRVSFSVPQLLVSADGPFMNVYFSGPSGCRAGTWGKGRYCLQLILDGSAILHQLNAAGTGWIEMARLKWNPGPPRGGDHTLVLMPSAFYNGSDWIGNNIEIVGGGTTLLSETLSVLATAVGAAGTGRTGASGSGAGIVVPVSDGSMPNLPAAEPGPAMIEVRKDVAAVVHISKLTQTSAVMEDSEISLNYGDVDATADYPVTVWGYGSVPGGASLGVDLYGWNGTSWQQCATVSGSEQAGAWGISKQAVLIPGCTRYKMRFSFSPNPAGKAPVLSQYGVWRPARYDYSETTEKVVEEGPGCKIEEIYIDNGGSEVTQEVATVSLVDDGRWSNPFDLRRNIPIRIECDTVDPRDLTTPATAILFIGRVVSCVSEPATLKLHSGSAPGTARRRLITCAGEGSRLTRRLTQHNMSVVNLKITDAIKQILGDVGIPSDGAAALLDCPDWPMTIAPFEKSNPYYLESFSDVYGVVQDLVENWLGAYLRYDPAAVPSGALPSGHKWGMYRVLDYPQGTETPIARFVESVPTFAGQTGQKLAADWRSFVDPAATFANRVPYMLVKHGTLEEDAVAPEMNELVVTGIGYAASGGLMEAGQDMKLVAVIRNYRSALFYDGQSEPPDPTSIDYLGEVVTTYECNTSYATQQVVDNVAKARMRKGGQGYYTKKFEAPVAMVWDRSDARQARPRPLRFGDVVAYRHDGGGFANYIVSRVQIMVSARRGGARLATAVYTLNSPLPDRGWTVDRS